MILLVFSSSVKDGLQENQNTHTQRAETRGNETVKGVELSMWTMIRTHTKVATNRGVEEKAEARGF